MDVTKFQVLLFVHILAAIVTLGPVSLATGAFPRFATVDGLPLARLFHKATISSGIGSVVIPIFGLLAANELNYMDQGWVQSSVGIFLGMLFALFVYIIPEQRRVIRRLERADVGDLPSVKPLQVISGLYSLGWAVILYFMVVKPF
jgi:hypothetical protein